MKILAIETSCDETSAAVIGEKQLASSSSRGPIILSNVVSSQINLHAKYGGVVPEVAARAHIENIIPVIKEALSESETKLKDIDHIAVTYGPGLIGSLVVGVETAKALSLATGKPVVPINHLEGHIYANFIRGIMNYELRISNKTRNSKLETRNYKEPQFPIIALLVSGGHSMLIYMKDHLNYKVIGQTRDDAAGEAFDKGAKILGLGYPGGPIISHEAEKGDAEKYNFPVIDLTEKPKRGKDGFLVYPKPSLDFSFSGLKTSLLAKAKQLTINPSKVLGTGKKQLTIKEKRDLAAGFQKAIIDTLVQNSLRAVGEYKPKTFILSGGVAANKMLRETLGSEISKVSPKTSYLIPDTSLCTDNAAMIGAAAYYHINLKKVPKGTFSAEPNLKF